MRSKTLMTGLFVAALASGMANAAVVEDVKANDEGLKKFSAGLKIVDVDGEKAFVAKRKGFTTYYVKQGIKIDPDKKYQLSVKIKQFIPSHSSTYIGFIPVDAKNRGIRCKNGSSNTKGSATVLASNVYKGSTAITVNDASNWEKGGNDYVAFNVKDDLSDTPNFEVAGPITKIEETGNVYTIELKTPFKKGYPAGTKVRQHSAGNTYIYTKIGVVPTKWTVWKGKVVTGATLRKATTIRPMLLIRNPKGAGIVFTDLIVEELD